MKNPQFLTRLFGTAVFMAGLALSSATQATTLSPGDLIKGPLDAVYYYAANGKRLVFPTEKTYMTWYTDFTSVKTITSDELAAISMGGNVTYRPGVKLVKVTTDPKVYAVSKGGTLRWVKTETLAAALYGTDWNTKIDDVPDTYFTNYIAGAPIEYTSDYTPATETSAVTDINIDKNLSTASTTPETPATPPSSTTTADILTFTVSKTTLQAGDIVTLIASTPSDSDVTAIELFFDGMLTKTCYTVSCSGETQVPFSGTKSSYLAEAKAHKITNEVIEKSISIPVQEDGSSMIQIRVGQSQIMINQMASAIAEIDSSVTVQRIDIYVDGSNVRGCTGSGHQCQWSDYLQGSTSSVHPVYATVTDTIGRKYTSETKNITLSTFDTPRVEIVTAKNSIAAGETLEVTVTASDSDAIAWIEILKNDVVIKHCDSAAPCTANTGPWYATGTSMTFSGRAKDAVDVQGVSEPVIVNIQ
ncbi:MAG: hypothetical protein ABIB04_00595 [Patescibacteria group bacterium]